MLLEFYGTECPHCIRLRPLLERLEKEEGVKIERYEVWHDDKNAAMMEKYAKDRCEGVPFLFNTETQDSVCGEAEYDMLKKWAGVK